VVGGHVQSTCFTLRACGKSDSASDGNSAVLEEIYYRLIQDQVDNKSRGVLDIKECKGSKGNQRDEDEVRGGEG
jgi:hypothetical protein